MKDLGEKEELAVRLSTRADELRAKGEIEEAEKVEELQKKMVEQIEQLRERKGHFLAGKGELYLLGYQVHKMQQGELVYERVQKQEQHLRDKYKLAMGKLQADNTKLKLEISRLQALKS